MLVFLPSNWSQSEDIMDRFLLWNVNRKPTSTKRCCLFCFVFMIAARHFGFAKLTLSEVKAVKKKGRRPSFKNPQHNFRHNVAKNNGQIHNYGPGTRDGHQVSIATARPWRVDGGQLQFIAEAPEFDRQRCDASMADQQEDEPWSRLSCLSDSERLPTLSSDDLTASWTVGELRQ